MASAKATLSQMFSWCPLGPRNIPITDQQQRVDVDTSTAHRSIPEAPLPSHPHGNASAVPDLRQCEPWRHAQLRETSAGTDIDRIGRLSR